MTGRRRAPILAVAVTLVALGVSPSANSHGGGAAKGYTSTITAVVPTSNALQLAVLDADDRLQLRVIGSEIVVIDGYDEEPYLRFAPDGVFRNRRSPATYLNDDRYAKVEVPDSADPKAAPDWEKVAPAGRAYDWHDHRIHWMSPTYPPKVSAAQDRPHHIFNWTIPGTLNDQGMSIRGSLDYRPTPGQTFPTRLLIPTALLALLAVVVVILRLRRLRADPRPGPDDQAP